MKRCKTCGTVLPQSEFYSHKLTKDRLTSDCKACCRTKTRKYKTDNPDRYKAGYLAYTRNNATRINARQRERRKQDPDKFRQRDKEVYERLKPIKQAAKRADYWRHREARLSAVKEGYRRNPEPTRLRSRQWREEHPEQYRATLKRHYSNNKATYVMRAKKRERMRRAVITLHGQHTESEWQALLIASNNRCVFCGSKDRITRDHIIPLSKGGTDLIENIQPLCRTCNARKGAKLNYAPPCNTELTADSPQRV